MQATLCIVGEDTTERSQLTAALEGHGLTAAGWVLEQEIDTWIEQQQVQVWAQLRENDASCHVVQSYLVSYLMMPSSTHSFCCSACRALYVKPHSLQCVVSPPEGSNFLPALVNRQQILSGERCAVGCAPTCAASAFIALPSAAACTAVTLSTPLAALAVASTTVTVICACCC